MKVNQYALLCAAAVASTSLCLADASKVERRTVRRNLKKNSKDSKSKKESKPAQPKLLNNTNHDEKEAVETVVDISDTELVEEVPSIKAVVDIKDTTNDEEVLAKAADDLAPVALNTTGSLSPTSEICREQYPPPDECMNHRSPSAAGEGALAREEDNAGATETGSRGSGAGPGTVFSIDPNDNLMDSFDSTTTQLDWFRTSGEFGPAYEGQNFWPGFPLIDDIGPVDDNQYFVHGYDGSGGWNYLTMSSSSSDILCPSEVIFDFSMGWDLTGLGDIPATLNREMFVQVIDSTDNILLSVPVPQATLLAPTLGSVTEEGVSLSLQEAGVFDSCSTGLRVRFAWHISEEFTGPAQFVLDNVAITPLICPVGEAFIPSNYWIPPLDKPEMSCENVRLKIPDHGEFSCIPVGQGICRDNGGAFGKWRFGIEEVETPPCELSGCRMSMDETDLFPVLIDPANTRYPITGTTFTDSETGEVCKNGFGEAIRGCNYAGTTHVCISENIESDPNRYSNERPYMFFYDEKSHQYLYQLVCDGIGEEGKLPELKMVNQEGLADAMYVDYPVDIVKFKKGATPNTDDSNELWKMYVDWNGFEDPETRRIGKLASFIGVAHNKFCKEYVSATDKACWKEDCNDGSVATPEAYERDNCIP